ncbi:LptA/OstA family protein [Oceanithermus sp.]
MNRKSYLIILLALLVLALATAPSRIIKISYLEGKRSGNLRYGPWIYESSKPDGIIGTVGDLEIRARKAVLEAPEGKSMQEAEGERKATFEGGVTVLRGRLTAKGPSLTYSERTGLGVLSGPAKMHQEPAKEGQDPVDVESQQMSFNVDTDISTSIGNVKLTNGNQQGFADSVYYEEERGLAVFTMKKGRVKLVRKRENGDLIIYAPEVRSLTKTKKLIATGGVELVDGDLVTRGDALYYDDETGEAIVIGKPARSSNEKEGFKISGGTLLHNVKKHRVQVYRKGFKMPLEEFKKVASED